MHRPARAQVHATLIGLERAAAPFDPAPLAAPPARRASSTAHHPVRGFAPDDRRLLSRGAPLHERMFSIRDGRAVLLGWPVVRGTPSAVAPTSGTAAPHSAVTHRHGRDPDVRLVVADVPGPAPTATRWPRTCTRSWRSRPWTCGSSPPTSASSPTPTRPYPSPPAGGGCSRVHEAGETSIGRLASDVHSGNPDIVDSVSSTSARSRSRNAVPRPGRTITPSGLSPGCRPRRQC
jgi:hypothetical protein